jgi:hypothetical protein
MRKTLHHTDFLSYLLINIHVPAPPLLSKYPIQTPIPRPSSPSLRSKVGTRPLYCIPLSPSQTSVINPHKPPFPAHHAWMAQTRNQLQIRQQIQHGTIVSYLTYENSVPSLPLPYQIPDAIPTWHDRERAAKYREKNITYLSRILPGSAWIITCRHSSSITQES